MLQSFVFWFIICFLALPFVAYPLSWGYLFIREFWITTTNALMGPAEAWYYENLSEENSDKLIEKIKQEDGYQALYWFTYPIRACVAIASLFYAHMKEK